MIERCYPLCVLKIQVPSGIESTILPQTDGMEMKLMTRQRVNRLHFRFLDHEYCSCCFVLECRI